MFFHRFAPVRKKFQMELMELKLRDQTPYTAQSVISLLYGIKFFRVKVNSLKTPAQAALSCFWFQKQCFMAGGHFI